MMNLLPATRINIQKAFCFICLCFLYFNTTKAFSKEENSSRLISIFKTKNAIRSIQNTNDYLYISTDNRIVELQQSTGKSREFDWNICETRKFQINQIGEMMPLGQDCYLANKKIIIDTKTSITQILNSYSGRALASGLGRNGKELKVAQSDGLVVNYIKIKGKYQKFSVTKIKDISKFSYGRLIPISFDPGLVYLAMRNWSDYYIHIFNLETGKLMHKTEYYLPKINSNGNVFSFSPNSRMYFDGKRIRQLHTGKLLYYIDSKSCCILKQSLFSTDSKYLAILKHANSFETRYQSVVEVYKISNMKFKKIKSIAKIENLNQVNAISFDSKEKNTLYLGFKNGALFKTNFLR